MLAIVPTGVVVIYMQTGPHDPFEFDESAGCGAS